MIKSFKERIAQCDVTHDELVKMRNDLAFGRNPNKQLKSDVIACLGMLRDILDEARQ